MRLNQLGGVVILALAADASVNAAVNDGGCDFTHVGDTVTVSCTDSEHEGSGGRSSSSADDYREEDGDPNGDRPTGPVRPTGPANDDPPPPPEPTPEQRQRCDACRLDWMQREKRITWDFEICRQAVTRWAEVQLSRGYYRGSLVRHPPLPKTREVVKTNCEEPTVCYRICRPVNCRHWTEVEPNPEYIRRMNEYLEPMPGHTWGDPSASSTTGLAAGGLQLGYTHNGRTHSMTVNPSEGAGTRCGDRSSQAIEAAGIWFGECARGLGWCTVPGQTP
jgi:hypothetical protein